MSRCHIINTNFYEQKKYDYTRIEKYKDYIYILENKQKKSIPYLVELYSLKTDELKIVFEIWIKIYSEIIDIKLNNCVDHQYKNEIINQLTGEKIINRIKLLIDAVEMLKYNVNTRVLLDKVVIGDD